MPDTIRDGTGKGYLARVSNNNELATVSVVSTEEHAISSGSGLAYFATTATTAKPTLTGTGSGGVVLYIQNDHTSKQLAVAKIFLSSDTAGINFT